MGPTSDPEGIQNSVEKTKITSIWDHSLEISGLEGAPKAIRAGAVEGVRGRHKSLPQRTWIRILLELWISSCSTRPEAYSLGGLVEITF